MPTVYTSAETYRLLVSIVRDDTWLYGYSFRRTAHRKASLKRLCDCGHWIDGSEPYRYQVWRLNLFPRGVIEQRTECEFCYQNELRG